MIIPVTVLARPVDDVDFSDLTDAARMGPAVWTDGGLEVPFDRDLTDDEVGAVVLRLTSADAGEESARVTLAAYLENPAPTVEDNAAQLRVLTMLAMKLMDGPPVVVP